MDNLIEDLNRLISELDQIKGKIEDIRKECLLCTDNENYLMTREKNYNLINDSGLSVRAISTFKALDVITVSDLYLHSKSDFFKCRNFGKKTYNEINDFLKHNGFKPLRKDIKNYFNQ